MKKLSILCVILMITLMVPMAAAITVDGHKDPGEWDGNWSYGQIQADSPAYNIYGPFGDRLVIRQGAFGHPTTIWNDIDPMNDSSSTHDESMTAPGALYPSGYDIKSISVRLESDTLYGLCEVYGIPGDLEGNGDIATEYENFGDTLGVDGPAGSGIGLAEIYEIRATQGVKQVSIQINDNNWTVYDSIALTYADVDAKFSSTGVEPCYEIAISGMASYFNLSLGAEPIKIEVRAGGLSDGPGEDFATAFVHIPDPAIDIEKSTNTLDADNPVGPVVDMNDGIIWEYVITNTGVDPLSGIVVTDDPEGNIVLPQTILDPQESMTVQVPSTATVYGQYSNIADVVGYFDGIPVVDEDPSHYYVFEPKPAIDIEKHTNGYDADNPKGPRLYMNDTITWEYIVTNIGDVTLNKITVIDDKIGEITLPVTTLASGALTTGTVTSTVTEYIEYENSATVTGEYDDTTVDDEDPSHYYCLPPTDVPALTPTGLLGLIGVLGMIGIFGVKRRD